MPFDPSRRRLFAAVSASNLFDYRHFSPLPAARRVEGELKDD
jgi:hypothetical protein